MDARKSAIFAFQFVKTILQSITHLIQYTVLEIQFWSVKSATVTVRYAKISNTFHSFPSSDGSGCNGYHRLYENKLLQNTFKRI